MSPQRLFHPSLYQFDTPQPSYWEATASEAKPQAGALDTTEQCDVAIIGGGYTGLSAALHLARDYDIDVRLLEAGHIGWGASGRNGGFCTIGGTKLSLKSQFDQFGIEQTRAYYQSQIEAIELVKQLGADENIDYLAQGDREFFVADSKAHMRSMIDASRVQKEKLGLNTRHYSRQEFEEIGYRSAHQYGATSITPSFCLHPLRFAQGLAIAAVKHGAVLHAHSEVLSWHKRDAKHVLKTRSGEIHADRVILTGNGFMPEHLHAGVKDRPLPLQSAIVVTRPLSDEELEACGWKSESPMINSAHMFNYYRLLTDRRIMIGGRGNHIGDPQGAERIYAHLGQRIAEMWPNLKDIECTHQWRGLVNFSLSLRPSIGRMPEDPSVYFAYGYHGNGVNFATWSGRELARWLAGAESNNKILPTHLPAILRGRPPKFPLGFLRRQYLLGGLAFYKCRDWLGI